MKISFIALAFLLDSCGPLSKTIIITNSSPANEPALLNGSKSELVLGKNFELGDFIAFYPEGSENMFTSRLMAESGDTIQMINGTFYLNGQPTDRSLNLIHRYIVNKETVDLILNDSTILISTPYRVISGNTYEILLSKHVSQKYRVEENLKISPISESINYLFVTGNLDNFQIMVVPKGKVFVLSDNRHNGTDSRYFGFVSKTRILGKLSQTTSTRLDSRN